MRQQLLANLAALAAVLGVVGGCVVVLHALERATSRVVAHHWGWRGVLVTGWLGVPLHELSHLASALLFGHRIVAFSLFDPDPTTGTLGYVRHAPRRASFWQRLGDLCIGISPVIAGSLALGLLATHILPRGLLLEAARPLAAACSDGGWTLASVAQALLGAMVVLGRGAWVARSWWLPLQLYGCIAIACHMAPSFADLHAKGSGASALVVGVTLASALAACCDLRLAAVALAVPPVALLVVSAVAVFEGLWVCLVVSTARLR